jgi:nickel-dependent lactate racemase
LVEVWLPYGRSEIPARVPDEHLTDIIKPANNPALSDPIAESSQMIASNDAFVRKAKAVARVCLVFGSCGSRQLTTDLARTVLHFINSPQNSTVICTDEAVEPETNSLGNVQVERHNGRAETLGWKPTSGGFIPEINSRFAQAELRVLIGELRPHPFLGYAGLPDLIFPSLGSTRAHLSERPPSSPGVLHTERLEITKSFDNLYMLGLVLDGDSRVTAVKFGETEGCLDELQALVNEQDTRVISKRSDIVVMSAGGSPFDTTLDRAVESFPSGVSALKKDGALIVAAECESGHGGGHFYEWCSEHKEPRHLETRLRHHFSYSGFKASSLARVLQTHRVYLVSTIPDHYIESNFGMRPSSTVNAALQTAQRALGSDSTISVIPNACRVITKQTEAPK